ncbi:MAG TPA: efflux RND transporter periplasmic adaptor subunit [Chiayiivirga sp.]|nr:efflux RND transporter periplasmic adaptor subunit [Chiayiivirga sp.]
MRFDVFRSATLLAAFTCLGLGSGCSQKDAPSASRQAPAALVTVATVMPGPWQDEILALGTAQANESVTLTAKVTEKVTEVNFNDGDYVEAGAVLVDLSGRAEVAQLEASHATFVEASKQYERLAELVKQGTIPRSQLDTQLSVRDAARARADAIRAALADRVISAPFAGVLGFRRVSPGALVTPGTIITTLDDIRTIKLDFPVPEAWFARLQVGQAVEAVSASFPEQQFAGRVSAIGSRVDPLTRAVTIRAELPNPKAELRPGMLMSVRVKMPERQALVAPEIAALQVGSRSFVYRLKPDDTVEAVDVVLGARRRGAVEIVSGIDAGDRIVIDGTVKLRNGAKVRLAAPAPDA